jgi:hypothetical protein
VLGNEERFIALIAIKQITISRSVGMHRLLRRQRQRARDRESSTSSLISASTSSLSAASSNGSRLDNNSDDMQDLQFQAEMDRYDELYARARLLRNVGVSALNSKHS